MNKILKPYFTIIIATYNAAATVVKCIESALTQTETPQIIVVDGLSQDRTIELLKCYTSAGVEIISEKDHGVYDAWNKGISRAIGEWIIFLGADDYYADTCSLMKLRQALMIAPEGCCLAYGVVEVVDKNGNTIAIENKPWEQCRNTLSRNMPYTHVGSAHHTSLFTERVFNTNLKIAGDYNFLYPVLKSSTPLYVPSYITKMNIGGLSTSMKKRLLLLQEIQSVRQAYNIDVSSKELIWTQMKIYYFKAKNYVDAAKNRATYALKYLW